MRWLSATVSFSPPLALTLSWDFHCKAPGSASSLTPWLTKRAGTSLCAHETFTKRQVHFQSLD